MTSVPVISIDGPTASGKGTIAQRVANALKFHYLDSGSLYRLVAWKALQEPGSDADESWLVSIAEGLAPEFSDGRIRLDGNDVTDAIRTESVSGLASKIAVHVGVRQALLDSQRAQRRPPGLVADGRDMGTIVFPDACLKIYLTASLSARAARRYKQLMEKGFPATIAALSQDQVECEIRTRDERDSQRETAPLKPANDAHVIDASELGPDEVVALVLDWSRDLLKQSS
ncbi:MAG: (d)CMP kinase [Pseudomonadota bacterium]|nr:(d)CMP kinase [Pseudomonadota bacterium]